MTEPMVRRLREIEDASLYSLELRVSIDHFEEEKNDTIRGEGSFRRALKGAGREECEVQIAECREDDGRAKFSGQSPERPRGGEHTARAEIVQRHVGRDLGEERALTSDEREVRLHPFAGKVGEETQHHPLGSAKVERGEDEENPERHSAPQRTRLMSLPGL